MEGRTLDETITFIQEWRLSDGLSELKSVFDHLAAVATDVLEIVLPTIFPVDTRERSRHGTILVIDTQNKVALVQTEKNNFLIMPIFKLRE